MDGIPFLKEQLGSEENMCTLVEKHMFNHLNSVKWYIKKRDFQLWRQTSEMCTSEEFNQYRFQLEMVFHDADIVFNLKCLRNMLTRFEGQFIIFNHLGEVMCNEQLMVEPSTWPLSVEIATFSINQSMGRAMVKGADFRVWCRMDKANPTSNVGAQPKNVNKRRRVENANNQTELTDDEDYTSVHCGLMSKTWRDFCCNSTLSDVTLVVGQERIPAHRMVLYAASDTFRKMLPSADDIAAGRTDVEVKDVEPELMLIVLHFIYVGSILPNYIRDLAWQLWQVARRFQLATLERMCERYIVKHMTTKLCLDILLTSSANVVAQPPLQHLPCNVIHETAITYLQRNYDDVTRTSKWANLKETNVDALFHVLDFCYKHNVVYVESQNEDDGSSGTSDDDANN